MRIQQRFEDSEELLQVPDLCSNCCELRLWLLARFSNNPGIPLTVLLSFTVANCIQRHRCIGLAELAGVCSCGGLLCETPIALSRENDRPGQVECQRDGRAQAPASSIAAKRYRDQARSAITTGTEFPAIDRSAARAAPSCAPGVGPLVVMFRSPSPRAAADLACFVRQATGGIDSNWPRLMVLGTPGHLAALVERHKLPRW